VKAGRIRSDEVAVWCVAVETRSSSSSCRYYGDLVVDAAQSSGYLANIVTDEQSFGSSRCPWIITAPRGQRLNVSLLDFGLARRHEAIAASPGLGSGASGPVDGLVSRGAGAGGGVCHVYAKIAERGAATSDITVSLERRPSKSKNYTDVAVRSVCRLP